MLGGSSRRGIFVTTSDFSKDALEDVERIEKKIVLIDAQQLAEVMIDYDIGVMTRGKTHLVQRVDCFDEP